jgi:GT2 family glycosyltransferase
MVVDCRDGIKDISATLRSIEKASSAPAGIVLIGNESTRKALAEQVCGIEGIRWIDHPSGLSTELPIPDGSWICPIQPGDELSTDAISAYALAVGTETSGARVIYVDDDLIDQYGHRHSPHFKPDWNRELFRHHDFISNSCIILVCADEAAQLPFDHWINLLLREAIESRDGTPVHLPLVLHHRRDRPSAVVPAVPQNLHGGELPAVTAIVPTRNQLPLLRNCLDGLMRAAYPKLDCIIIDNDSDDPATLAYLQSIRDERLSVLHFSGPFNYSAMNNAAARTAQGDLLCFLNNDIEILDHNWLSIMVRHAVRGDLGAIGAKLLYPDGTLQHAGVVLGVGGGAGHAHRYLADDKPGYFNRAHLPQLVSAVTAACMVVARDKFLAVGGFDEEEFPVAFNDVDLCLKLNARGWQSFYEPRAKLVHHESKSRGNDRSGQNRVRFAGELAALKRKWKTDKIRDPFHHPHLSPFCEQFLISV